MARGISVIDYLPDVLKDSEEIKAINLVENEVLEALWEVTFARLNNQFILTADSEGLSRYEKMLKLKVSETDTLETRRFNVLARFQEKAPYTWKVLNTLLNSLLGEGNYVATRDVVNKKVSLKIELTVSRQFDVIVEMLERILPANMTYQVDLRYNTYDYVSQFTHNHLSGFTHNEIREDVL